MLVSNLLELVGRTVRCNVRTLSQPLLPVKVSVYVPGSPYPEKCSPAQMDRSTVDVIFLLTVIVILLERAGVLQGMLLVKIQFTTSPVARLLLVKEALSVPAGAPFNCHCREGC